MMKKKLFRNGLKLLLVGFLACGSVLTALNTKAATGYIYDSDGMPIESSVGLILNNDGIYNVNSTAWINAAGDNIEAADINNMLDMYVYSTDEDTVEDDVIYVVDGTSNKLFIFDGRMNFIKEVEKFEIDITKFTTDQLSTFKTRKDEGSGDNRSSKSYTLAGANSSLWSVRSQLVKKITDPVTGKEYEDVIVPFEKRTENQRFYINCFELTGVYRATRPEKDEYGVNTGNIEDLIYLCDTKNAQIVIVDANTFEVVQIVTAPKNSDFEKKFAPVKMVTDSSGRMYIISSGVYEGIILLSNEGEFMRYVGVNYTTLSFWQAFTRNFKTEEQLAQETSILSTIFNNLTIDDKGFLYTVSGAISNPTTGVKDYTMMVKRINQAGKDVLIRNGYALPQGDLVTIKTGDQAGGSNFTAIDVNKFGVYTVIDSKMNRLFTYDNEGNLLYISGGKGSEQTDLANPVAVSYQGDSVLVLDQKNCAVLRYEPTDFAKSINNATKYQFYGDSVSASDEWQNVITANPNYQLAYVGVGKTLLEDGRYQEAMLYFEKGQNVPYYSRAYKKYRDGLIKEYFPFVMYGTLVLVGGVFAFKLVKKFKNKSGEEGEIL